MACPITVSTLVGASPATIFAALTESAGLASFWTSDSQAEPVVGSIARLGFPTGTRLDLRVDALDPGRRVVWTSLTTVARPPRWTGTTVTWELKQAENGATEVLIEHGNWPDDLPQTALAQLTFLWAQVLRSLKAYAETGTPQPIFARASIVLERTISATPERVFTALTRRHELAQWWTRDASATPEVGSLAEFRFNQGAAVRQFEVAELVHGERVRWIVRRGPAHWAGTSVTWQLTPVQNGTRVLFTQDGFARVDALYAQTRFEWDCYLDSLKAYLETGEGTPYVPGELDPL